MGLEEGNPIKKKQQNQKEDIQETTEWQESLPLTVLNINVLNSPIKRWMGENPELMSPTSLHNK